MTNIEKEHMALTRECAEVAKILHIPKARLRNGTVGRPLKIAPSIKTATGTGSRNLWSWLDLVKLAAALILTEQGFAPHGIKEVLNEIEVGLRTHLERPLLLTNRQGKKRTAEYWRRKSGMARGRISSNSMMWITINLKELVEMVDRRIYVYYKMQGAV